MTKQRNKIVTYEQTSVQRAFDKEAELLKAIQKNELEQALLLWSADEPTLVLPASNKWNNAPDLDAQLRSLGWLLHTRRTGGAPVPQTSGVINLSHIYLWSESSSYSIPKAYDKLCQHLTRFFQNLGLATDVHATPFSYCDGDYNLNISGKKIVGTAQRVMLKHGGGSIVLVQACLLIDADMEEIITPVVQCYRANDFSDEIKPQVHTCLFDHIAARPSKAELYQALVNAFS